MRALDWTLLVAIAFATSVQAEDCALSQRYLQLAQDRAAQFANDEAIVFLRQAIDACPTYDAYERLGELAAQSPKREDTVKAVEAFVNAEAQAPSVQARAQTLYQYAALLNREGDPQNAYPLIEAARRLDPERSDISALAGDVDKQVQHPTTEHIVRALRYTVFVPLKSGTRPQGESTSTGHASARTGPSVNIPINFDTASVVVDQGTRPNLEVLAHALTDPALQGRQFTFIGHADRRGGDQYNVDLSLQRAEAISQNVVALEPSLKGRIRAEGRGAREPIDTGNDEAALRANRRLQVIIR